MRRVFDLAPQSSDEVVHGARGERPISPDGGQEVLASNHLSLVRDEIPQHLDLEVRQRARAILFAQLLAGEVDLDIAKLEGTC